MKKQAVKKLAEVDLQIVTKVATELASLKTDITTLEVKNELRSRGYFVNQTEVSALMNEMYEDPKQKSWSFKNNGNHRIYSLNLIKPSNPTTISVNSSKSYKGKRRPSLTPLTKSFSGCWEVKEKKNNVTFAAGIIYYDSKETRDAVRCDYAKLKGVSFNDVRARKVK